MADKVDINIDWAVFDQLEQRMRALQTTAMGGAGGGWATGPTSAPAGAGGGPAAGARRGPVRRMSAAAGQVAQAGAGGGTGWIHSALQMVPGGGILSAGFRYAEQAYNLAVQHERVRSRAAAVGYAGGGGYGYNMMEAAGHAEQFYRAAGIESLGRRVERDVMGLARAGYNPSDTGGFLRGFSAGGGMAFEGMASLTGKSMSSILRVAIKEGMDAGLTTARVPEFLRAISEETAKFADQGVTLDIGDALAMQSGLADAGMQGLQGMRAISGVRQGMAGLRGGFFGPQMLRPLVDAYMSEVAATGQVAYTPMAREKMLENLLAKPRLQQDMVGWAADRFPGMGPIMLQDLFGMGFTQAKQYLAAEPLDDPFDLMAITMRGLTKGIGYGLQAEQAGILNARIEYGRQEATRKSVIRAMKLGETFSQSLMPPDEVLEKFAEGEYMEGFKLWGEHAGVGAGFNLTGKVKDWFGLGDDGDDGDDLDEEEIDRKLRDQMQKITPQNMPDQSRIDIRIHNDTGRPIRATEYDVENTEIG